MSRTSGVSSDSPLVSVILATCDRPRLLPIALRCFEHQTYPRRELVVVDDGAAWPVDRTEILAAGGRLVRVPPGTALGAKLNAGVSAARGEICQKFDDNDWYAPGFLDAMIAARRADRARVCRPAMGLITPFLYLDIARWQVRRSMGLPHYVPGATLQFAREDWEAQPFRAVQSDEEVWFLLDHQRGGAALLPVQALETYVAVSHAGSRVDRGKRWTEELGLAGQSLDDYVRDRAIYGRTPEDLLPHWALAAYRAVYRDQVGGSESPSIRPAAEQSAPRVLILTPVKNAARQLDDYCNRVCALTYPHRLMSLAFLESDSTDGTFEGIQRHLPALQREFRRVGLWKRDFGYRIPDGLPRWAPEIQLERRTILARSRNHLVSHALDDEDWVLWLDVDVVDYPGDLIEQLLATGREIVQPHCVLEPGGPTFDLNGWRDHGQRHLDDLRSEGDLVELDAVGGTVLFIRADLHRDGLNFPPFPFGLPSPLARPARGGEIETEGLGIMAHAMGYRCWGMPALEVFHRDERGGASADSASAVSNITVELP
jgi:glycosyltransferase involved in cell wall biosynthesis